MIAHDRDHVNDFIDFHGSHALEATTPLISPPLTDGPVVRLAPEFEEVPRDPHLNY